MNSRGAQHFKARIATGSRAGIATRLTPTNDIAERSAQTLAGLATAYQGNSGNGQEGR